MKLFLFALISVSSLRVVFFSGDSFCTLRGVKRERGTREGGMRQGEPKRKPVWEASLNSMWISRWNIHITESSGVSTHFQTLSLLIMLARLLSTSAPREPLFQLPLYLSFKMPLGGGDWGARWGKRFSGILWKQSFCREPLLSFKTCDPHRSKCHPKEILPEARKWIQ